MGAEGRPGDRKGTAMAGRYQMVKVLEATLCGAEQDMPEGQGAAEQAGSAGTQEEFRSSS